MRSSRKLLIVLVSLAAPVFAGPSARMVFSPEVTVQGDVVRVRDLAALDGDAANQLADLTLTRAPSAGETRTLDGGFILGALYRGGMNPELVTYTIPAMIRVRRASQEIGAGQPMQICSAATGTTGTMASITLEEICV